MVGAPIPTLAAMESKDYQGLRVYVMAVREHIYGQSMTTGMVFAQVSDGEAAKHAIIVVPITVGGLMDALDACARRLRNETRLGSQIDVC